MDIIKIYIDYIATIMEAIGVLTIFIGSIFVMGRFIFQMKSKNPITYKELRQAVGKSILLGLEILIAADIIATVVTEPTLLSVSILGLIVLIRTFLSLSLQVELEGKFPWQKFKIKNQKDNQ
ncbi:putative membrane protein [Gelidibacter algens]|uniref:Putative membrane protein n=1 Tax=Gelidibacter algens TaxID=49280 RepID=A0A1A7R193_9FLAO|nr:DUF1622 domain-containing protein [Gelidibacter algens]OBX26025.1 hypothetical protein A9996_06845 [Gelidibacter algens]RAJ27708.1 putative membrane protein [Gelidibacter algens]